MSEPRTGDLRDGFDAFTEDMAEHQRTHGVMPTPAANQNLAAAEFEQLEHKGAFAPRDAAPAIAEPEPEPELREQREVNGREYTLTKDQRHGDLPVLPGRERQEMVKILQRLRMLLKLEDTGPLGAPSWRTRVIAVMDAIAVRNNWLEFLTLLDPLLEESSKYFGDWAVDPEPKIFVGA